MKISFYWKKGVVDSIDIEEGNGLYIEGTEAEKALTHDWWKHYQKGIHKNLPQRPAKTAFGQRVIDEMSKVPFGTTISYSELADRVGNKKAVRAVGGACGRNHLPLLVPCHRILAKDCSLCGFNKGLKIKKELLELEHAICHTSTGCS